MHMQTIGAQARNRRRFSALAACTVVVLTGSFNSPALLAQSKDPNAATELSEIVVTGSMLHRTDIETPSPVTILTELDIQRSGLTTVADVVRTLSSDNSGTLPTAFGNAFATGASGVALRGLTVNSTLVLIDGRRAAAYALGDDGFRSFVDLNSIPLSAIERVEILKDGASSIYGADAIAGVVNVILKKQYQGAEVNAEIGVGQHAGGGSRRLTATAGAGDLETDRFNAYINFEFQGDDRILASDRPFPFNNEDLSSIGGTDNRVGTPGSNQGTSSAVVAPSTLPPGTLGNPLLNTVQSGAFRPLTSCGAHTTAASAPSGITGLTDNYCQQNRFFFDDEQPAEQRIAVNTRFTVKINDGTQAYLNAGYSENNVYVDNPPSFIQNSTPLNTNNIALPPTLPSGALNPNNPFAAAGNYALIYYAFGDIPVKTIEKNHNARFVTGLKGKIFDDWDYDTALVINHTWLTSESDGYISGSALLAAVTDGTYNFVNPSMNSAAIRSAIAPPNKKTSTTDLDSLDFKVTHDIVQLPGGPLGVALGGEFRYEAQADPQLNPNNTYEGLGVATVNGQRTVGAAYFEFGAPVVKQLEFNVSGRFDHYSDFGNAFTPKAGFKFTPIKEFAVRGTYSKGFRAPAFGENGSSEAGGFVNLNPTAGAPFPANYCAPNVHSPGYCLQYSVLELSTGNPNIKPEKSDSYTFGLIFEPGSIFNASADYYYIKKTQVISPADNAPAFAAYFAGQPIPTGFNVTPDVVDAAFPGSLARPASVGAGYVNASSLSTDGIDIDLRVKLDFGSFGQWVSDLSATKIFSWKIVFPDGSSQQYVGTESPYALSSGAGTPRYRGSFDNTYIYGPLTASINVYYVSGMAESGIDYGLVPCIYSTAYCHIASFTYADLTGSYKINDHLQATFAMENIMDRLPPINPANYAGTNYNPTYNQAGIVGRYFRIGASYKF
jgi:iron complex outermembrane receptor protein